MNDDRQQPEDTRSPMAKALDLVSQLTTISLMAVLPAVGGYFIDNFLNTKIVFILIGLAIGLTAGGFQLMKLVKRLEIETQKQKSSK